MIGESDMDISDAETQVTTPGQELNEVKRKQHFTGTVVKATMAGALVDIGVGTPGVVHISQLQTEPVNRVEDIVQPGQQVDVWVQRVVPKKNRIELTMIKPLDLEWREIEPEMVIKGKVTRLEKFGVFVDIGAERPGLVHISEMTHGFLKDPSEIVKEGDEIDVKVLNVNRQKRQIKLSMKALEKPPVKEVKVVKEAEPVSAQSEEPKEEPVPTAMEIALREAMERSKGKRGEVRPSVKSRKKGASNELEQILLRTLHSKVKTR
jgi:small subunit ribosomal protein S1